MSDPQPSQTVTAHPEHALTTTKPSLLGLPREIRDKIYDFALTNPSSQPITISRSPHPLPSQRPSTPFTKPPSHPIHQLQASINLKDLALGLLRCNRLIAREVAEVFYVKNVFRFESPNSRIQSSPWHMFLYFLRAIGAANRNHLRRIQLVNVPIVEYLSRQLQLPLIPMVDRTGMWDLSLSYQPYSPAADNRDTGPATISSAIDEVFNLLDKCKPSRDSLGLAIVVEMDDWVLPVMKEDDERGTQKVSIADVVERRRRQNVEVVCGEVEKARVEVLWKGRTTKYSLKNERERMESKGWEVLEMREEDGGGEDAPDGEWNPILVVAFTLRRRRFVE
jgi:hypothetical protein